MSIFRPPPCRRPSPADAFTLLELLLAVSLATLALGMATSVAIRASRLWAERQEALSDSRAAWSLVHRMGRELRMALPPNLHGEDAALLGERGDFHLYRRKPGAAAQGAFEADMVQITLRGDKVRFALWPTAEGGAPAAVEYSLQREGEGSAAGVVRRSAPLGEPLEDAVPVLVARNVASLALEYLDASGKWRDEWSDAGSLPQAVRLSTGAFAPNGGHLPTLTEFSTTVYVPAGTRVSR